MAAMVLVLLRGLRLLAAVHSVAAPTAATASPQSSSLLTYAACSDSGYQRFSIDAPDGTGRINDDETGRCLTVRSCGATALSKPYEAVQLDDCGVNDLCDGNSQQWKASPIPGKPDTFLLTSAVVAPGGDSSTEFCLNAVSDKSATEGIELVVWKGCSAAETNQQWIVTEQAQLKTNDPAKATTPCMQAMPCVAPCVLPGGWGSTFLVVFAIGLAVYVVGGALYAVQVQGKSYQEDGAYGLLPQAEFLLALRGLAVDGANWSFDLYVRMSSGGSGLSRKTAYANAGGSEERRFSAAAVAAAAAASPSYGGTNDGAGGGSAPAEPSSHPEQEPLLAGEDTEDTAPPRPPPPPVARTKSDDL